jgi:hypothetical protein
MMCLIPSYVSGDEVRTARYVTVMSRSGWFGPMSNSHSILTAQLTTRYRRISIKVRPEFLTADRLQQTHVGRSDEARNLICASMFYHYQRRAIYVLNVVYFLRTCAGPRKKS